MLHGFQELIQGDYSFDDQERYLQMSMKIEPSDPMALERNENYNDLQISKRKIGGKKL